jgi:type II secretory pathway pseudopilin PulG
LALACALHSAAHVARTSLGFTLVEVSVATGILVVTALGTAQLFAIALRQNMAARDQTLMALAAARALDQIAAAAAGGRITASASDCLDRDCDGFADMAGDGGGVYARRWIVSFPSEYGGATAAVVVRVFRPDAPGIRVEMGSLAGVGP